MTTPSAKSPFVALIEPYEWNLLVLAHRQVLIEAFTGDLDRVTRGKLFRFRNHSLWLMLLDTREVLVIHLTNWALTFDLFGCFLSTIAPSPHRRKIRAG